MKKIYYGILFALLVYLKLNENQTKKGNFRIAALVGIIYILYQLFQDSDSEGFTDKTITCDHSPCENGSICVSSPVPHCRFPTCAGRLPGAIPSPCPGNTWFWFFENNARETGWQSSKYQENLWADSIWYYHRYLAPTLTYLSVFVLYLLISPQFVAADTRRRLVEAFFYAVLGAALAVLVGTLQVAHNDNSGSPGPLRTYDYMCPHPYLTGQDHLDEYCNCGTDTDNSVFDTVHKGKCTTDSGLSLGSGAARAAIVSGVLYAIIGMIIIFLFNYLDDRAGFAALFDASAGRHPVVQFVVTGFAVALCPALILFFYAAGLWASGARSWEEIEYLWEHSNLFDSSFDYFRVKDFTREMMLRGYTRSEDVTDLHRDLRNYISSPTLHPPVALLDRGRARQGCNHPDSSSPASPPGTCSGILEQILVGQIENIH